MAAAGADGLFRCGAYEGCISGSDVGKERRPYHRNCGCALHNRSENKKYRQQQQQCTHGGQKSKSVSYPLRRAWSEGNLGLVVANGSCCSGHSSPSTSPAAAAVRHHRLGSVGSVGSFDRLSAFEEEEEEEDIVFFKV